MGTPSDPLRDARGRLRRIARREPYLLLRLLEPEQYPLIDAFLLGLAVGGFSPTRRWFLRGVRRRLP